MGDGLRIGGIDILSWALHWNHSCGETQELFGSKFPETPVPQKSNIKCLSIDLRSREAQSIHREKMFYNITNKEESNGYSGSSCCQANKSTRILKKQTVKSLGFAVCTHICQEEIESVSLQDPSCAELATRGPRVSYAIFPTIDGTCDSRWRRVRQLTLDGWGVVSLEWLCQFPKHTHMVSWQSLYLTWRAFSQPEDWRAEAISRNFIFIICFEETVLV